MKKILSMVLAVALVLGMNVTGLAAAKKKPLPPQAAPTASMASGTYDGTQYVKLSGPAGATIRYTTNGRAPTASSTKYSKYIKVTKSTVIKAIAVRKGYANSPVLTVSIGITAPMPSTAYIPAGRTFPLGGGKVVFKAPTGTTMYLMLKGMVDDGRQLSTKVYDYKLTSGRKVTVGVSMDLDVQILLVKKGYANKVITRSFLIRTESVEALGDDFCAKVLEGVNDDRWNMNLQMPDGTVLTNIAPAIMDAKLSAIAQAHAMKLATEDNLYHSGLDYDESVCGPLRDNPKSIGVVSGVHNPALCSPNNTRIGVGAARALSGLYYVVVMAETEEKAAKNN
jgi:hypothetical protein